MAYADQKMSSSKIAAIVIVALIHAALGYAFVTGLAYKYVKAVTKDLNAFDVEEPPPPPPDEPPPPPPDQPLQPPPVVSPPPLVSVPTPPIIMQTVPNPLPPQPPTVTAPPPAPPPPPRVSQAAKLGIGDIQRLFGDPANYPDTARDAGAQGTVRASVQIDGSGRVVTCNVAQSSGNAALDAQTCRLFKRIKASPAKDEAGNGIASTTTLRFTWKLPEE